MLRPAYADLTARFYAPARPELFPDARLLHLDRVLAHRLGWDPDWLATADGRALLTGQVGLEPVAMAYAGHQFGRFSRRLGDGRAVVLGHVLTPAGERLDIALKGGGPTPFTHRGDGYLTLASALHEAELATRLAERGIAVTRVLAVLSSGRDVARARGAEPGGLLVRAATSHIRIGTFQYAAARRDNDALSRLVDWTLARHCPDALQAPNRAAALLNFATGRQRATVSAWMAAGFVHGVLNTDNLLISGEAIDLSSGGFVDDPHPPQPATSDPEQAQRYAFANQPHAIEWALARLAEALSPLTDGLKPPTPLRR